MADNKINVTVSANTRKNITVSSAQQSTEITASTDTGRFWAQTSKNWAVSDVIVDNTDYSSKHYAGIAKESAENAQNIEEIVKNDYNTFLEASMTANSELQATKENAITEIESNKINAVDSMNAVKNDAVDSINSTKTTVLNDIEFVADGEKKDIQDLADEIKDSGNTVNTAIEAGVERLNSIDSLKNNQITNCILEIPQRIKYTLEDGTLTIKAGSVVIVPYGTEDLTAQYPKGATFLHENFKVYDAQFADDKFFVWAELVSDVTKLTTVADTSMRLLELIINANSFMHMFNTTSGTNSSSFTGVMYRTDLNRVNEYASGTQKSAVVSLPLLLLKANGSYLSGSVENVFNGFGYIGSTVWVDKGVKALLANGRNEDNSLKSLEITTSKINTVTEGSTAKASAYVLLSETGTLFMRTNNPTRYYDGKLNYFITDGKPATCCVCATQTHDNTSKILSLDVKTPFRVADYNDLPFIGVCESKATTAGGATKERPAVIVRNYRAGSSWYRVWSDGWIEQGGIVNIPAYTTSVTKELTVLENFSDTNYSVFTQMSSGSTNWANVSTNVEGKTTSGFEIRCYQASGTGASIKAHNITWFACGY